MSIGMLVDAVSAARAAHWSAQDMARLVIALDAVLDEAVPQTCPSSRPWSRTSAMVPRRGRSSEEAIA